MPEIALGLGSNREHKIVRMLLISLMERENQKNYVTIRLMSAMLSSKCNDFKQTEWRLLWTGQKILSKTETQMLMRIYSSDIQIQHSKHKNSYWKPLNCGSNWTMLRKQEMSRVAEPWLVYQKSLMPSLQFCLYEPRFTISHHLLQTLLVSQLYSDLTLL